MPRGIWGGGQKEKCYDQSHPEVPPAEGPGTKSQGRGDVAAMPCDGPEQKTLAKRSLTVDVDSPSASRASPDAVVESSAHRRLAKSPRRAGLCVPKYARCT